MNFKPNVKIIRIKIYIYIFYIFFWVPKMYLRNYKWNYWDVLKSAVKPPLYIMPVCYLLNTEIIQGYLRHIMSPKICKLTSAFSSTMFTSQQIQYWKYIKERETVKNLQSIKLQQSSPSLNRRPVFWKQSDLWTNILNWACTGGDFGIFTL